LIVVLALYFRNRLHGNYTHNNCILVEMNKSEVVSSVLQLFILNAMKPERYKDGSIFEFADKLGYKKSPFGNWMEEERLAREQREQERAEREAEKEDLNGGVKNKLTGTGNILIFLHNDDTLTQAEKALKNAPKSNLNWDYIFAGYDEIPFKAAYEILKKYSNQIKNVVFCLHGAFHAEQPYLGGCTACGRGNTTYNSSTILNIVHDDFIIENKEFIKESFDYMYKIIQLIKKGNVIFTSCNAGRSKRLPYIIKLLVEYGLKERIPVKLVKDSNEVIVEKEYLNKINVNSRFISKELPLSSKIEKIDEEKGVLVLSKTAYTDGMAYIHLFKENKVFEGDVTYYFNGDKTTFPVDWFVDQTMWNYYKKAKGYVHDVDCFDGTLSNFVIDSNEPSPKKIIMRGFFKLDVNGVYSQLKDKQGYVYSIKLNRTGAAFEIKHPSKKAEYKDVTVAGVNPILELIIKATEPYEE
jgi:hypothetical protein